MFMKTKTNKGWLEVQRSCNGSTPINKESYNKKREIRSFAGEDKKAYSA